MRSKGKYPNYRWNIITGKGFSNEENFGQFPLQVNGFRDVHESLEAATAHGAIETVSNDTTQKSGQEVCCYIIPLQVSFKTDSCRFLWPVCYSCVNFHKITSVVLI